MGGDSITNFFTVRSAELEELDENEEILQTGFWASFKARSGWQAHPLALEKGEESLPFLVLSRRLKPAGVLVYVPFGPPLEEPSIGREELLLRLTDRIAPFLPVNTFAVRYDLPWFREGLGNLPQPLERGKRPVRGRLKKSGTDIQPVSTVILDIGRDEDAILKGMKSKTRYNIRLSFKKGVEVEEGGEEKLEPWYQLHRETGARDRIAVHSLAYYRGLFETVHGYSGRVPEYRILLARAGNELLGGIIVGFWGRRAWYPYGASSGRRRNLMPNYALQWRAIQLARERDCTEYDLFGIPPSDDPKHAMAGLFQFKTGFGGRIINRMGCFDVVLKPAAYSLYNTAESVRRFYYKGLMKKDFMKPFRSRSRAPR